MSDLYELPDGWEWKKFQELFTITSSKRVHKKDWLSKGIPFYRAREIVKLSQNGFVDNELFISEEMYNTFVDKYGAPKKDDILVTGVGTLGIPYIVKENDKFYFKDGNIIWLKNDNNTNSKFIEYSFQSEFIKNQINSNSGSTVATYTITNANNTIIPLPPLSEQQRIVSKLDKLFEKIDKAIALHQKNMDEADVFMGSVLNDVFGELEEKSKICKIDDIYVLKTGGTPSTKNKDYWDEGDIKWLSSSDINQIQIYDCKGRITKLGFDNSNTKIIEKDSVLIALNGQGKTRGSVAILRTEATLNQSLVAMIPKDRSKNLSDFLFRNLQMRYIEIRELTGLNDRRGLNMNLIRNIEVPIPPLQIQQKVVSYLDEVSQKIEKIKQIQKEKMENLKALKASILDQAFRGEL